MPELVDKLKNRLDVYTFRNWNYGNKEFIDRHKRGVQEDNGLPSVALLLDQQSKRIQIQEEKSNVAIFEWPEDDFYSPLLAASYGTLSDFYKDFFVELYKSRKSSLKKKPNLLEYLRLYKELYERWTPIDLTYYGLKTSEPLTPYQRPEGLSIFLIDSKKPIADLCLFWNYRLSPHLLGMNVKFKQVPIPIDSIRNPKAFWSFVSLIQNDPFWKSTVINLFSASISQKRIASLSRRLEIALGNGYTIRREKKIPPIVYSKLIDREDVTEILEENGRFSFKKLWPKFGDEVRSGTWVNEVVITDTDNRRIGFPDSSKLNELLCGKVNEDLLNLYGGYWIRQTPNGLACRVNKVTRFVEGKIVSKTEAFTAFFNDKGYSSKVNKNHSYAEGFKEILLPIGGAKLLSQESIRSLFWSLSRKNVAVHIGDLKAYLSTDDYTATKLIDDFVTANILLRGVEFSCEGCGLKHWYPIKSVDEHIVCVGCLNTIRIPLYSNFTFKLNQLIETSISLGAIPQLLLEHLLLKRSFARSYSLFGLNVSDGNVDQEVDLCFYDHGIILAECKEYKNGIDDKQLVELKKQIRILSSLAKKIDARAVVFAAFSTEYPIPLVELCRRLGKSSGIAVNILNLLNHEIVDLNDPKRSHKLSERPIDWLFR